MITLNFWKIVEVKIGEDGKPILFQEEVPTSSVNGFPFEPPIYTVEERKINISYRVDALKENFALLTVMDILDMSDKDIPNRHLLLPTFRELVYDGIIDFINAAKGWEEVTVEKTEVVLSLTETEPVMIPAVDENGMSYLGGDGKVVMVEKVIEELDEDGNVIDTIPVMRPVREEVTVLVKEFVPKESDFEFNLDMYIKDEVINLVTIEPV